MIHNASSPPRRSTTSDIGLAALLAEYAGLRRLVAQKVRDRFQVGDRVLVPRSHGGTLGTVDGYHGSEVDALWVQLDVPANAEMRRALVPAGELVDANANRERTT